MVAKGDWCALDDLTPAPSGVATAGWGVGAGEYLHRTGPLGAELQLDGSGYQAESLQQADALLL